MGDKIRVGLLIDSYNLSLWEFVSIERLINSDHSEIVLVIVNTRAKYGTGTLYHRFKHAIYHIYRKIDRKVFSVQRDAFAQKNLMELLPYVPVTEVNPECKDGFDSICSKDISKIREYELDVLVKFGFGPLRGDVLKISKHGVWSFHQGGYGRLEHTGFWEVMDGIGYTRSALWVVADGKGEDKVIFESYSQTDENSPYRTKNAVFWKSLSFLPRKLEELHRNGKVKLFDNENNSNQDQALCNDLPCRRDIPGNLEMLGLLGRHLFRVIKRKASKAIYFDQWILMFGFNTDISEDSFPRLEKVIPPKDRFYADPFVVRNNNKYYVFFEELEYADNKGYISVMEMDDKGKVGNPVKIIEKPYHLSYPFVFYHDGNYFMIPESRANRTIELYKCMEFPAKWEFCTKLMEGIEAVDATLLFHNDKWWLFANIVNEPGASSFDELYLFYSESIYSQEWSPHPLNPIVSDVRRARPGGRVFIKDNKLIRPSQNSSVRYGYGLKLNEITTLSEDKYEEREIFSIVPVWDRSIVGIHTYNFSGGVAFYDAIYRRRTEKFSSLLHKVKPKRASSRVEIDLLKKYG